MFARIAFVGRRCRRQSWLPEGAEGAGTAGARRRGLAAQILTLCAFIAVVCSSGTVFATEIPWRPEKFSYVAQDKPLKDLIQDFAASQGLSVVVDPGVSGTVNGKFNLPPREMLDTLTSSFGLTWYYDGSVLYVT